MRKLFISLAGLLVLTAACVRNQQDVIVITATFLPPPGSTSVPANPTQNPAFPQTDLSLSISPTPNPTRPGVTVQSAQQYIVQPGDTLSGIAAANGVSVDMIQQLNNLANPNALVVGQVLQLPGAPGQMGSDFKIIPDSKLVRGPGSSSFDVTAFVNQQSGFIRTATDLVDDQVLTAAQVVQEAALQFSVDPRLLLALLEYKSGWLSNPNPSDDLKTYPMGAPASAAGLDRSGLYHQLAWAADQLNYGYYGWKYRGLNAVSLSDGIRLLVAPGLNAGTVGVQFLLSQYTTYTDWQQEVGPGGFFQTYLTYFGNPFAGAVDPLVPAGLQQPILTFPFPTGETWFFTGGPHGGYGDGSAWSAIDFAPPDDRPDGSPGCYISDFWAAAAGPGIISRTDTGAAILDLDGDTSPSDGDETTGWSILYLHMASDGRIAAGTRVQVGDHIGHPSCEGGVSNATHMHFARRYNGEWIPVTCDSCQPGDESAPFVLDGWTVIGYPGQEYQGYMVKGSDQRLAEQGRLDPSNQVSWGA